MKSILLLLVITSLWNRGAAQECCEAPAEIATGPTVQAAKPEEPKRHPLKGVVIDVLTDKSALLVKHEEIPGVMKAMTMLLTVDATTLKSSAATKGAAITGQLVRKADGWWLEDVKGVTPQPSP